MTAETFTETLSRVMTSCGGTCSAVTRMSMMIMRSMNGMIHLSPAVLSPAYRPSRRTTPCSYSFTMRRPMKNQSTTMITGTNRPTAGMRSPPGCALRTVNLPRVLPFGHHRDDEPFDGDHAHARAERDGEVGEGTPVLPVNEDLAALRADVGERLARLRHEPLRSELQRPAPRRGHLPGDEA